MAAAAKKPDWILRIGLNPLTPVNHNLPDLNRGFNRLVPVPSLLKA
jgi:hypothetical protein